MASRDPALTPVLENEVNVLRTFWLIAHPETKQQARVQVVWEYLQRQAKEHVKLLMD